MKHALDPTRVSLWLLRQVRWSVEVPKSSLCIHRQLMMWHSLWSVISQQKEQLAGQVQGWLLLDFETCQD
eukprot:s321_g33.t1